MAPSIEVDDDVLGLLKEHAEPFVDTPNSVLRRLLGLAASNGNAGNGAAASSSTSASEQPTPRPRTRRRRQRRPEARRAQSGTILTDDAYDIPILTILDEHGGRAPTREVLDELGEQLKDQLLPADYEKLASGDIRWRNRAQFVRLRLIEQGDMATNSPRGVWEITDRGRDRLVAE